jgi:hypothetical protein
LEEKKVIKINALLLLAIIPLSIIGYWFAVNKESLFYLYEWLLTLLIAITFILSIINSVKIKSNLKWVSLSIMSFIIQFSVLCLFLGPFTHFSLFYLFYIVTIAVTAVYILTLSKVTQYKYLPRLFMILSVLFTLYMIFLQNLWGSSLS